MFWLFHDIHSSLPGSYNPMVLLVDLGILLWLAAYVVAIMRGFQKQTYCIPLVAISLNFTWEILGATVLRGPIQLWNLGDLLWLALDSVVVYQLLRYGRAQQVIPEIQRWYYLVLAFSFTLALSGQFMFTRAYGDWLGYEDSYLINFVMSVLFVFMYFTRRDIDDQSYRIAWLKMLGTGIVSTALVTLFPVFYPDQPQQTAFMHLLFVVTSTVDVVYVLLLTQARRAQRSGNQTPSAGTGQEAAARAA